MMRRRVMGREEVNALIRASQPERISTPPLGRASVLAEIRDYMARNHNVILVGPRDIGKTTILRAVLATRRPCELLVLDPFMGVSTHLAGQIRHILERGTQCIAATRTLDRADMGAVRRIAFRFTTVRVPPLSAHWIKQLLRTQYVAHDMRESLIPSAWTDTVARLAQGRPGVAIAIVDAARHWYDDHGVLPSPTAACIEATIRRVELHHARDGLGQPDHSRASSLIR